MSSRRVLLLSLFVLTAAWAASRVHPNARTESAASPHSSPAGASRPAAVNPIAVVTKLAIRTETRSESDHESHRNPFRYADELAAPPPPPAPAPSPPPPPPVKPDATFIGTADDNGFLALFSHNGAVDALREGELLESRYLVKKIEADSVLLEDRSYHSTTTLKLAQR